MELSELAERAVGWLRDIAAGSADAPGRGAEVYLYRGESRGLDLRSGRVETRQQSSEAGMGLRIFEGGRMGFASAGGLEEDVLPRLYALVRAQMAYLPPDEHRVLPAAAQAPADPGLAATLYDPSLFSAPMSGWVPRLLELQERVKRADPRVQKVLQIDYGEGRAEMAIASTSGLRICERGTSCGVAVAVVGEQNGEIQIGSASRSARFERDVDFDRAAEEAVFRTVSLLGARKLPSRRRTILFDPWVAGEILDLIAGALSAEAVQRGKSLFAGKIGRTVASPLVSFTDDPRRPGGLASSLYDDEGVPTARKAMVERGVLKDYFYDSYTALKEGRPSNGCAGRSGYKGLPGPGCSNFYLEPGPMSREELIGSTKDGILAFEFLGMHTADAISGEFSIGVSGVAVEGGRLSQGIKNAMISGNILDLLSRVDAVASDLTFYGSVASPTFRVPDVVTA
ncbi:MAG: TldD/PmbA family protein [Elusimicrobia bacterium]|nr:TldD/PmbA family protein [Elusimicrobiota bacterium]